MKPYDWTRFDVYMHYACAPERLFRAWSTARGLESFFLESASFVTAAGRTRASEEQVQAGDSYAWRWLHGASIEGDVLACADPEAVAFTFGGMHVRVTVSADDSGSLLHLHQSRCRDSDGGRASDHLNCRSCWVYFLTNLKSVLEHGTDLRDRERPLQNDSIAVHYRPADGRPV